MNMKHEKNFLALNCEEQAEWNQLNKERLEFQR